MFNFMMRLKGNGKVSFFRFTRTVKIFMFFVLFVNCVHLVLSFVGTEDWFSCNEELAGSLQDKLCEDLMKIANCNKFERPLKGQIRLTSAAEKKILGEVLCGWENPMTELRICFDFGSLLTILAALTALSKKNRHLADLSLLSSYFFTVLLTLISLFDYLSVQHSKASNFPSLTLNESPDPTFHLILTYTLFNFTTFWGFFTSLCLAFVSYLIRSWTKQESKKKLQE